MKKIVTCLLFVIFAAPILQAKPNKPPAPEPSLEDWDIVDEFNDYEDHWCWDDDERKSTFYPAPGECSLTDFEKYVRLIVSEDNDSNKVLLLQNMELNLQDTPSSNYIISVDFKALEGFDNEGVNQGRVTVCFRKTPFGNGPYPSQDEFCGEEEDPLYEENHQYYEYYGLLLFPWDIYQPGFKGNWMTLGWLNLDYPETDDDRLIREFVYLCTPDYSFHPKKWHNLTINVISNEIEVYMDNQFLCSVEDGTLVNGGISLKAPSAAVLFDNFKVKFLK